VDSQPQPVTSRCASRGRLRTKCGQALARQQLSMNPAAPATDAHEAMRSARCLRG